MWVFGVSVHSMGMSQTSSDVLSVRRELYSVEEAARILGVSVRTLREWEYAGRIRAVRLGRRVMFSRAVLADVVERGLV